MTDDSSGNQLLQQKAMLLIQRERELTLVRQRYRRALAWLLTIQRFSQEAALHDTSIEELATKCIRRIVSELGFKIAMVSELKGDQIALLAQQGCSLPFEHVPFTSAIRETLAARPQGFCNESTDSSSQELAKLLGLERFMWYRVPAHEAFPALLIVTGFDMETAGYQAPFDDDDLTYFQMMGQHFEVTLKNIFLQEIELQKKSLEKDLEVTGAVQSLLLPEKSEYRSPRYELSAFFQSSAQAGGDWWWYDAHDENHLTVLMGDVTGHGVGSAMVSAIVASSYQTYRNIQSDRQLPDMMAALNLTLKQVCRDKYWMTFSALKFDLETATLHWWSSSAPPVFLMKKDGSIATLNSGGHPLGSDYSKWLEKKALLNPGDRILVFTDGCYDVEVDGKRLGLKGLQTLLQETRALSAEMAKHFLKKAIVRGGMLPTDDDVTFVVVDMV